MKKLPPNLANLRATLQAVQDAGSESPEVAELGEEIDRVAEVLAKARALPEAAGIDIIALPKALVSGPPDVCPCCGRPFKEAVK